MENTPLSKLQFNITKMLLTNGNSLQCFANGNHVSLQRITTEYEIALFLNNEEYTLIDDKKYSIPGRSLRFLKPGQSVCTTKFNEVYVIHFTIDGNKQNQKINSLLPIIQLDEYDLEIFKELFDEMMLKYIYSSEESNFILNIKFCELLALLLNKNYNNRNYNQSQNKNKKNISYINNAIRYIEEKYNQNISLIDIANEVKLHSNYLHKIFKESVGITPREYLAKTRLLKAKKLLITTTLPISDISIKCGFDSTSYFIKVFKKEYNMTPLVYRTKSWNNIE